MRKNSKYFFFTLFCFLFSVYAFAESNSTVEVLERSQNRIVVSLRPFQIKLDQVAFEGRNFYIPRIKNYGRESELGTPMLPMTSFLLPLSNAEVEHLSILESDFEIIPDINILPNIDVDSNQFSKILNTTEQFWPEKIIKVESHAHIKGQKVARIQINPIQYNAKQKTLKVYNNLKIGIKLRPQSIYQSKRNNIKRQAAPDWYNPSLEYYKLYLAEDGIYSFDFEELNSIAALPLNSPSANIKIINKGEEIPIWIEGDDNGIFSEDSKIYFYGERNRGETTFFDFFSDTSVYWLTFDQSPGKRYELQNEQASATISPYYTKTLHFETDSIFYQDNKTSAIDEGEGWIWGYLFDDDIFNLNFSANDLYAEGSNPFLKFRVRGTTQHFINPDHHLRLRMNEQTIYDNYFDDEEELRDSTSIDISILNKGNNSFDMQLVADTGAEINRIYYDWVELKYPAFYSAENHSLQFSSNENSAGLFSRTLFNFEDSTLFVLDFGNDKIWRPEPRKTSFLAVESAALDDGNFVQFSIDLKTQNFRSRGHNLAIIDEEITFLNFDTFREGNADDMAELIEGLPENTVVLAGIADEGSAAMTERAHLALESLGSSLSRTVGFRDSWSFIGWKGAQSDQTAETVSRRFNGPAITSDTLFDERASKYAFTFTDNSSSNSKYIAAALPAIKSVPKIKKDTFTNLQSESNAADYIIITHNKFKDAANELANYRATKNNFRTAVVDIEGIYDEFNFGVASEKVAKNFIEYAVANWQAPSPKYILFFGDASWDPQFRSVGASKVNYVPSYGTLVADNWFVSLDGENDILPDLYTGRIPVETQEQAEIAVQKIIDYEQTEYGSWNKEILFLNGGANDFEQNLFQLQASTLTTDFWETNPVRAKTSNLNKTTSEPFTRLLKKDGLDKIEYGLLWINFLGHGASSIWDIDLGHPDEWRNDQILPFVTGMSCHSARFANPVQNSLSEEYFLHPRGVAAYWGSSGFGYINQDYFLLQGLFKSIALDSVRSLGEATSAAKYYLWEQQGDSERNRFVINQYVLIGDPAMQLRLPTTPEFSVKSEDIFFDSSLLLISDSTTTINARVDNFGLVPTDSISIDFKAEAPSRVSSVIEKVKLPALENSDSTSVLWDIPNTPGEYNISVVIDPENKFEEENELNNEAGQTVNIFTSDLLAIKPVKNGVVTTNTHNLTVNNSKNGNEHLSYFFEIDTNRSFTSPNLSVSSEIEQGNLITSWMPTLPLPGTYFWRVRTYDSQNFGPWANSSFLYSPDSEIDWYQSGIQFSESAFEKTVITNEDVRLQQNQLILRVESAGFFQGSYGLVYVNNQAVGQSIRGHNIVILDPSDGSFIDYHNVDTFGDVNASDSLALIVNSLENGTFVLVAIADEGSVQLTETGHQAMENIGSQYTRQIGRRDSWAIIGRKGATIGSVPELLVPSEEGLAVVADTLLRYAKTGSMTSTEIGSALQLNTAVFNFISENTTESIAFNILSRNASSGNIDTLIQSFKGANLNLTEINNNLYPKIQLQTILLSNDGLTTPLLNSWAVDYKPPPDLVIADESIVLSKDTLQTAEQFSLTINSGNFGLSPSDSFSIRLSLAEAGQAAQEVQLLRVPGISVDEYKTYNTIIDTDNLRGKISLNVGIDALNEIAEINESNNFSSTEFWVVDDTLSPEIRLTFDGQEIARDEYVALSPRIIFEITDKGAVQFTDTSQVTIFLDNEKIPFGPAPGQADFITHNDLEDELKATIIFTPILADGDHLLEIIAKDASNNSKYLSKNFIVNEDFSLTNVMNYPNPFSRTTEFTYILTQPADDVKIKIFTVAGRLIMILEHLPLKVGFNQFLWNGRDRDGDRIANGVYLYKIIAKQASRQDEVLEKFIIMR